MFLAGSVDCINLYHQYATLTHFNLHWQHMIMQR